MSYTPPLSDQELLKSIRRFKAFFYTACTLIIFMTTTMFLLPGFWKGNIIWSFGSYITLVSVITNRYFDIKKTANKRNQLISIENIKQPSRNIIKKWLTIEKLISFLWIIGTTLVVTSRWINK